MELNIAKLKETPHWSYSAFQCYLTCPMRYYFRYVEQAEIERTGVCFPFGRAFHAVLSERALKGEQFKLKDAKESFAVIFEAETDAAFTVLYNQIIKINMPKHILVFFNIVTCIFLSTLWAKVLIRLNRMPK